MNAHLSIALLLTTGCVSTNDSSPDGPTLPSDAYFIYDRVDECLAQETNPYACAYAVALCRNGRAGARIGDIVEDGEYELDGPIARGTLGNPPYDHPFELDVSTGDAMGAGANHFIPDLDGRWQTLQFDSIDCSRDR